MAVLPNFRRIFKSDYDEDDQALVEKLSVTINNGFEMLYNALNRKLTIGDNFAATVKDIEMEVDARGVPTRTAAFNITFDGRVGQIVVGRIDNLTNAQALLTGAPFVLFRQNDKLVEILQVTGLSANQTYRVRLTAYKE